MSCAPAIDALESCQNSREVGDFPRSTGPNRIGMLRMPVLGIVEPLDLVERIGPGGVPYATSDQDT